MVEDAPQVFIIIGDALEFNYYMVGQEERRRELRFKKGSLFISADVIIDRYSHPVRRRHIIFPLVLVDEELFGSAIERNLHSGWNMVANTIPDIAPGHGCKIYR